MTGNAADDPPSALIATLRQLTSGDSAARAAVTGPAEVQEAARLLNALADEHGQQQRQAQEYARLRTVAREAGNRIRASLSAQEVIPARADRPLAPAPLGRQRRPRAGDGPRRGPGGGPLAQRARRRASGPP